MKIKTKLSRFKLTIDYPGVYKQLFRFCERTLSENDALAGFPNFVWVREEKFLIEKTSSPTKAFKAAEKFIRDTYGLGSFELEVHFWAK